MEIKKVAVLFRGDPKGVTNPQMVRERHLDMIRATLPEAQVYYAETEDELLNQTDDADVLLTWGTYQPVTFCKKAKSLKWIQVLSAGIDGLLSSEIGQMDIRLSTTKDLHNSPMSDTCIALMYAFLRNLPRLFRQQQEKKWQKFIEGEEIYNKTIGIVGIGSIGEEIARKCKGLGMRVVASKRRPAQFEFVDELYLDPVIDPLLEESDFVVLTIPLTDATRGSFNKETFKKMKKTAYLIDLSRGGIVVEKDLIEALRTGEIAGAGLDVFEKEPLPQDDPLWEMENVIVVPHMSAHSPYYMDRAFAIFCDNLGRFARGEALKYEVDRARGY